MKVQNVHITLLCREDIFASWQTEYLTSFKQHVQDYIDLLVNSFYNQPVASTIHIQLAERNGIVVDDQPLIMASVYRPRYSFETIDQYWALQFNETLFQYRSQWLHPPSHDKKYRAWYCFNISDEPKSIRANQLKIEASPEIVEQHHRADSFHWDELINAWHSQLFYERGVMVPQPELVSNPGLPTHAFRIWLNDLPYPLLFTLPESYYMEMPATLSGEIIANPHELNHPRFVNAHVLKKLEESEPETSITFGWLGMTSLMTSGVVQKNTVCWCREEVLQYRLEEQVAQDELRASMMQQYSMEKFSFICSFLSAERIPIRNLRKIMELMLMPSDSIRGDASKIMFTAQPGVHVEVIKHEQEDDLIGLIESLRRGLNEEIAIANTKDNNLQVILIDFNDELECMQSNPEDQKIMLLKMLLNVEEELKLISPSTKIHGILCQEYFRPTLSAFLLNIHPWLSVFSYRELAPWLNITPLHRITIH